MEVEFLQVSPRKAAKHPGQVKTTPTIRVDNRFQSQADTPTPTGTKEHPATINLKPRENYNTLLKEITEKFPGTENKFLFGYINIKATSEENRQKIVQFLMEKNEELILLEATIDRPIKVVLKGLHVEANTTDIVKDLKTKGFRVSRISQMRNYKLQKTLNMFLMKIKKVGNYQNIYNIKEIGYGIVKLEPYRRKNKATICYNCTGYHHSARNCHQRPRCIKCNGAHPTRECNIKEKIEHPVCINCGEKDHLAVWNSRS